ncbi:BHMT1 methyltransferase, partial [Eolophus roseicapillus]|nr:BHMT1 methyltransferase [Eolophus roseicapilla]
AVRQLHREFLRAGSNVLQTFSFYASEDKLENRGNYVAEKISFQKVNEAACDIAREVANEGDALVAGGVSQTPSYLSCKDKAEVKAVFRKQLDIFVKKNVDFLIAEHFWERTQGEESYLSAMLLEPCYLTTTPLPGGGLSAQTSRSTHLITMLVHHLQMCMKKWGDFYSFTPVFIILKPRIVSRWDVQNYARKAYDLGIRYIGGCCGFEPYHIRAISEELAPERGFLPEASEKHGSWGNSLSMHTKPWVRARARKEYWENLKPASGRPYCPSMSKPDGWGVTKGSRELMQQKEATSDQQLKELFQKQKF